MKIVTRHHLPAPVIRDKISQHIDYSCRKLCSEVKNKKQEKKKTVLDVNIERRTKKQRKKGRATTRRYYRARARALSV